MQKRILALLQDVLIEYPSAFATISVFLLMIPIRFAAIDCVKQACAIESHGQTVDFINLGQTSSIYCAILIILLPLALQEKKFVEVVRVILRLTSGALLGYFFPILVMLGTQLVDVRFVYPYITLSALFGIILFTSTQTSLVFKIMSVIFFSFVFLPGAQIVESDVYRYAFEGKTDLSHSGGFYAILYSQIWINLTKIMIAFFAYIVVNMETLGHIYVKVKEFQQVIAPYRSSHHRSPETVVPGWSVPSILPSGTDRIQESPNVRAVSESAQTFTIEAVPEDSDRNFPNLPYPYRSSEHPYPLDHVLFGGYILHPLQFRILQLLPQNISSKKIEKDYQFRSLRDTYYPNRNISSAVILMEVYSSIRRHDPHILSIMQNGQPVAAQTRTARKLLIDWLIRMKIGDTKNYKFSEQQQIYYNLE
ncbi:hypothetical protein [Deinococcus sp.]|uniref:hypothetical protein n=1 Tax=Deinococcus sp. TaxID=47478 RepID=UPI003CC6D078